MLASPPVTKFTPPRLPRTFVDRAPLIERLEIGAAPVTLVTGFAGSGKTVLMTAWIDAHPERAATWLSCDSWDSDAQRFWTSVITALRMIAADVGADALDWIESDGDATLDSVGSLVNDLDALAEPTYLVIDDLHVVPSSATRGFSEFLERLPPKVRVVIGSRSEPLLPLHRWRVRDHVVELRDVDLRLRADETEAMLNAFGVRLAADDIAMLTRRTEGWAAGVQLAALSLRDRDDAAEFVHLFAGNDRNVADFLVGEVLERQEPQVVDFLMATSIVDQFDAELCNYLTGRDDAVGMLRAAEGTGLFLVPVDNERRSYRYHHLFRDLLRAELQAADRDRAMTLHLRAARWYEDRGDLTSALQHLMSGGDVARAFELLREHLLGLWYVPASANLVAWLDALPMETVVQERDRVLDFGLVLALAGRTEESSFWLERADDAAALGPRDDVFEARRETGLSIVRTLRGDAEPAVASATRALELIPRGVDSTVDAAPIVLQRALLWLEDFDRARQVYEAAAAGWTDPPSFAILHGAASLIECEAGNLRLANEYAERAHTRGRRFGLHDHPGAVDPSLTFAGLALERGEIDEAERLFEETLRLAESIRPPFVIIALLGLARAWRARGEWQLAAAMIERASEVLPLDAQSPILHMVNSLAADFALSEGELDRAKDLLATLPAGPRRSLVEVRFLLASGDPLAAREHLQRVRVERALPLRRDVEFTLLEARIAVELNEDPAAYFERAIELARTEGFVRTFVATDPVVAPLLGDFLIRAPRDTYTDVLMAAVNHTAAQPISGSTTMVDALSQRELAVLRWLPTRLTAREIADELFVSMNTLKSHLKSIYRKLDAASRSDAVARAIAQGLLPATRLA